MLKLSRNRLEKWPTSFSVWTEELLLVSGVCLYPIICMFVAIICMLGGIVIVFLLHFLLIYFKYLPTSFYLVLQWIYSKVPIVQSLNHQGSL